MTFAFDLATEVHHQQNGDYLGAVHEGWDIRGNANGGYVMALVASAMRDAAQRQDPISVTAHYLAPLPPGDVRIATEVVKRGKTFCTVSASMFQGEREAVSVIGAFGEIADPQSGLIHVDIAPPQLPPMTQCSRRPSSSPGVSMGLPGISMGLMDKLDIWLHPDDTGFSRGEPSGKTIVRGWINFADNRPIDTLSLLLVADAFPPPVFQVMTVAGWVPTVELTVHVLAKPASGPLRCVFTAHVVQGGMFEEDGQIWDSNDTLVAQSRQIGLVPLM